VGDAATIERSADRKIVLAVDRDPVTATSIARPRFSQLQRCTTKRWRKRLCSCRSPDLRAMPHDDRSRILADAQRDCPDDAVVAPRTIAYLAIGHPDFQRQSREFTAVLKAAGSHPGAISLDRTVGMPKDLAEWV
jgi:hypothetical protein